ncbi:MAG: hypothetical protein BGO78_11185 [Chloroflexi bacterium 44-23]|nr:MAG: hypothetical protein BGO78_11185 [Chloroflexi bacterium 44-23]
MKRTQDMNFPFEKPLVIAHRGARSVAPENTLMAARKGFELKADLWELDVALTSDGEMVVIHDDTLKRTSNVRDLFPLREPWQVHTFSLAELKTLDFGSFFVKNDPFGQIRANNVTPADLEKMTGLKIPTLREALNLTKELKWQVNVELKDLSGLDGDAHIAESVVALINELEMAKSVIISSFNHSYIFRVKAANASIRTAALVEKPVSDPLLLLQDLDAQAYNPGIKEFSEFDQIGKIRQAGFDVYIWTVNDAETMRSLINAGVSGIFTDFPQLMVEVLKEYSG